MEKGKEALDGSAECVLAVPHAADQLSSGVVTVQSGPVSLSSMLKVDRELDNG